MTLDFKKENNDMTLVNLKSFTYNKPDELLCIQTHKKITPLEKDIFDYILYNAKKQIYQKNINKIDNFLIVENMNLEELYAILGLKKNRNNKIAYILQKFEDLQNVKIIKINLIKGEMIVTDELLNSISDKKLKRASSNSLIGGVNIDNEEKIFSVYLSPIVAKYLIDGFSFTQTNVLVSCLLKSNYSKNLYAYLLNKFQSQTALMDKKIIPKNKNITTEKIEVKKLLDILDVPQSHIARKQFKYFNDKILRKAVKELNENNAVDFKIIDIAKEKEGKVIKKISFILEERKNKLKVFLDKEKKEIKTFKERELKQIKTEAKTSISYEKNTGFKDPLEELKEKISDMPFIKFVKELQKLKNIKITNALPNYLGKELSINEFGMLELDGQELENQKANIIRKILYKHPEFLGKFEKIDIELLDIKKQTLYKYLVYKYKGYYYIVYIKDIERVDKNLFKIIGEEKIGNNDNFYVLLSKEQLFHNLRNEVNIAYIEDYKKLNQNLEEKEIESFYKKHKDKFKKWLESLEKLSFQKTDELLKIKENTSEYKKLNNEIMYLDSLIMKGFEFLSGELKNNEDKIKLLKAFKEYVNK